MLGLITILVFVALIAVPAFYIITRKVFPKKSIKSAAWTLGILTAILIGVLAAFMCTAL